MVLDKIREMVAEQFLLDVETVTAETAFVDDLNADSLDVVELTMNIEDAFGLDEISEEDIRRIQTVGDLVAYVSKKVG